MRVLMIVVTRDQMVRNRVITVTEQVTQDELHSIHNYLNANFSGWELADIQVEVDRRLQMESAAYDAILALIIVSHLLGSGTHGH